MSSLRDLASSFADEAQRDYVGIPHVVAAVREAAPELDDGGRRDAVLALVAMLLGRGLVIGTFRQVSAASAPDYVFERWPDANDELLARLRRDWDALGRDPEEGELAWIVAPETPIGDVG